ncbi:MAG: hypothetical protein ACUVXI_09220 [bacterium]
MARAEIRFRLGADPKRVAEFIREPRNVGECLSFVGDTKEEEGGIRWYLKSPMSQMTRTSHFPLEFQASDRGVNWDGKGQYVETRGDVSLRDPGDGTCEVSFALEMLGLGPMKVVIEPAASVQISKHARYFAKKLAEHLGCEMEVLERG